MDKFEKKYGIQEDEKVGTFHRNRRMFCIYQNKLFIAESNLPYSHATWFEKEGWVPKAKDELMNEVTRGMIDNKGDIYFYIGYDFEINKEIEFIFFSHLKELVEKLKLKSNAKVFGGSIKQEAGKKWLPRKEYGKIEDNL
ncbi:hypothetical protein KAR26_02230 [Candidatus Parcubacteria bacterium]|nr:hypothetical protein [Candidatus Parcubacteria bacterium]